MLIGSWSPAVLTSLNSIKPYTSIRSHSSVYPAMSHSHWLVSLVISDAKLTRRQLFRDVIGPFSCHATWMNLEF